MANRYREIQIICKECKGTGIKRTGEPEVQGKCLDCNETGYIAWGRIKFKPGDFVDE
uniref:Uncharacterized protein n=1 Tax=viral metagenome TaxID=1070528 RepID=A0A6M3LJ23_9ZZZZ